MTNSLINKIDDFFKDPNSLSLTDMEGFVHETLKFFDKLRTTLTQGTPEEKKEALKEAEEMQAKLQIMAKKAYEKVGMSEEDIKKYLEKGSFPMDQLKHFESAKQEIKEFQSDKNWKKKV